MKQAGKKRSSAREIAGAASVPFRVRYHDEARTAFARLPMISAPDVPYQMDSSGFWALPPCSHYGDGNAAGEAAAAAYLRFLAEHGQQWNSGGRLQHFVLALFARLSSAASDEERTGLRGQIVGFFTHLECYTAAGAGANRISLLSVSEDQICRDLQDAIDGGPQRRYLERLAKERSEAARKAAQARWSKRKRVAQPT